MSIPRTKTLTARLPIKLLEAIRYTAEARGCTTTELVRHWLQAALAEGENTRRRYASLLYEIAKTRAVQLHFMELQIGVDKTDRVLALAEESAKEYVKERVGKEGGTG